MIIGFIVIVSFLVGVWDGFPRGVDVYNHLTRIKFIFDWWPNHSWGYIWAGGMPLWLWYTDLPYLIMAAIVKLSGQGFFSVLNSYTLFCLILSGIGIYLLVYKLTKSRIASLLGVVGAFGSPSLWAWWVVGGLYDRICAYPFMIWSIYFLVTALTGQKKIYWFLAYILLALTLHSQILIAIFTFGIAILLVLFYETEWRKRFFTVIKLLFIPLLLDAFRYLPFIISWPWQRFFGEYATQPINLYPPPPWYNLFFHPYTLPLGDITYTPYVYTLSPLLLTLGLLLLLGIILGRKYKPFSVDIKVASSFFIIFLGLVSYLLIWHLGIPRHYNTGAIPVDFIALYPLFLAPVLGVMWARFWKNLKFIGTIAGFIILLLAVFYTFFYQFPYPWEKNTFVRKENSLTDRQNIFAFDLFKDKIHQLNYRFASLLFGDTFNFLTAMPQTRDYWAQGLVDFDQRFFFEKSVIFDKDNLPQTKFLLDWWGIEPFFIPDPSFHPGTNLEKFKNDKQDFLYLGARGANHAFIYKNPSPILSATNRPAILVIGKKTSYDIVFNALSWSGKSDKYLIPVKGKEFIDDYSLDELKSFPTIFLYEYRYHNQKRAYVLLKDYLNSGGIIFWEVANSPEVYSKNLPDFFPLENLEISTIKGDWQFTQPHPEFSPPLYDKYPWKIYSGVMKTQSQIILQSDKYPLLAERPFGQGKIIFSGLNFPYHIVMYQNTHEAQLLTDLLVKQQERSMPSYNSNFINPQLRKISINSPSSGILFKEFYFKNWRAYDQDGKKLRIYRAGPMFMYIPINNDVTSVSLVYKKRFPEYLGWIISILTFLLILTWLLERDSKFQRFSLFKILQRPFQKWGIDVKDFWEKDE